MLETLQNWLLYIGSFVLVLGLVVFVHEYGHFRVGRWCGIAVKSFSIGLGSEWFGWTDKHGTRWKVSKIPLGGFVSWVDDTDGSSTLPPSAEHQTLSPEEARARGHFRAAPVWKRAITVAAGPAANFMFAILVFAAAVLIVGRDVTDYATVRNQVAEVLPGSAAAQAGVRAGEVIEAVDGNPIRGAANFVGFVEQRPGRPIELTLASADGVRVLEVTPQATTRNGAQVGVVGLKVGAHADDIVMERVGPFGAVGYGAAQTWDIVARTGAYVASIFAGQSSGRDIAGPVGIFNQTGRVASAAIDSRSQDLGGLLGRLFLALLSFAAVLSVAVGIVNLLPIPVLDGGHLLFYAIEAVRGGKPLPAMAQEWAFRAGFAVIASLFLFATWNDISRLFPATP
jgi:regulator of sigma E protease